MALDDEGRPLIDAPPDEKPKPHISYSQLNLYANCGEAYRRRYIEHEIFPPGAAALRGRAVHSAAEVNHRQKLTSGTDLALSDLADIAASSFDETRLREGVWLTPDEETIGGTIVLGRSKDAAVRLTGLYADKVAPTIDPALVEARIRIELPQSPMDMLGVIDVATKNGRIKDLKTAARAKAQSDADSSLQLTWYAMTYRAATGEDEAGLDMEVLIDTNTAKHQRLPTVRTRRDFEVLVARVNATMDAIKGGIFVPANAGFWMCSTRWCGYASTCPFYNAERKAAADAA